MNHGITEHLTVMKRWGRLFLKNAAMKEKPGRAPPLRMEKESWNQMENPRNIPAVIQLSMSGRRSLFM